MITTDKVRENSEIVLKYGVFLHHKNTAKFIVPDGNLGAIAAEISEVIK